MIDYSGENVKTSKSTKALGVIGIAFIVISIIGLTYSAQAQAWPWDWIGPDGYLWQCPPYCPTEPD